MSERFTVMSIPYRSANVPDGGEDDSADWFVWDREQGKATDFVFADRCDAVAKCRELNQEAK